MKCKQLQLICSINFKFCLYSYILTLYFIFLSILYDYCFFQVMFQINPKNKIYMRNLSIKMFTSNLLLRIRQYILAIIKCRISLDWEHFCLIIVSVLLWNSIALTQSPLLFTILSSSCVVHFNINHRHLLEPILISNISCVTHVGVVCVRFFFFFVCFFQSHLYLIWKISIMVSFI